jgi:hypothetical protein
MLIFYTYPESTPTNENVVFATSHLFPSVTSLEDLRERIQQAGLRGGRGVQRL